MAGNKIEKPEAVYYYCSRMGGVDLSDQLLNYFTFSHKSRKWSQKLLIHFDYTKCLHFEQTLRFERNDPG